MKNFKFKFLSLILCVCLCLSFFTGCSLFVKKDTADATEVVMTVGDRNITREELLNSYYSFYQQNSYYYMYYDEETIYNTFYDSVVSRYMILSEAERLMKSENGKEPELVFSTKDMKKLWDDIFDYVNAQIDAKEKSLLLLRNGNDEEALPERLQSEETSSDSETAYKYEGYDREESRVKPYEKGTPAEKVDDDYILNKIKELKDTGIYTYYDDDEEVEDDKERTPYYIEAPEQKAVRLEAFDRYISDLIFNAKANGKDSNKDAVLKAEIERIYKSYYETALYNEFQEYITSTTNPELVKKLNDEEVVRVYSKLYGSSFETNSIENKYKEVITGSSSSVTLYHYNGKYVYFSVQHILVPFDAETLEILEDIEGYDASTDERYRIVYEQIRAKFYREGREWSEGEDERILSTVKRDPKTGYIEKEKVEGEEEKEVEKKYSVDMIIDAFNTDYQKLLKENPDWTADEKIHAKAILFQQYSFMYSSDTGSLSNDLSGVLGFTISSKPYENGNFVKDFTNGARELFEKYMEYKNGEGEATEDDDIGAIKEVVSDYGVHIMMLTGVYEAGPVIDLDEFNTLDPDERTAAIVEKLQSTYISNLTDETYYDYIYDLIKDGLVGSNGTFFTDYRNALLKQFEDDGKVVYHKKLTYKQLSASVGA